MSNATGAADEVDERHRHGERPGGAAPRPRDPRAGHGDHCGERGERTRRTSVLVLPIAATGREVGDLRAGLGGDAR